jgi:predicted nucleic acid-binding protein
MVARRLVVDTSVAFKWFVAYGERSPGEAVELLEAHRNAELTLMAPSTVLVEIANTLRYLIPDPQETLGFLRDFEAMHIVFFEPTPGRVRHAALRASETGMGVYDALFLSLAEELECPLVSADRGAFTDVETSVEIRLLD